MATFDVVTVPDFSGANARRFELLTLFFLASWIESGNPSRGVPLHIAAIGEVPQSVLSFASLCSANLTQHRPIREKAFINKLRGFEVDRRSDSLLLLDTDVLVLSDLRNLPEQLGRCVAAAPASRAPISFEQWLDIYACVDVPPPSERMLPVNVSLDIRGRGRDSGRLEYLPYFNAGVVYCPWDCNLKELWSKHHACISELFGEASSPGLYADDQHAFTTAVSSLTHDGEIFKLLPDEYHARWQHLTSGAIRFNHAKLYHAIGFLKKEVNLEKSTCIDAVNIYKEIMIEKVNRVHLRKSKKCGKILKIMNNIRIIRQRIDILRLNIYLTELYNKHVIKYI